MRKQPVSQLQRASVKWPAKFGPSSACNSIVSRARASLSGSDLGVEMRGRWLAAPARRGRVILERGRARDLRGEGGKPEQKQPGFEGACRFLRLS